MAAPRSYRPSPGEIPVDPGVYRFRDDVGRVIYVGKAKSLRPRLSSYFQDTAALHPRTQQMVRTGASVELPFASKQVVNGEFTPTEKEIQVLGRQLVELSGLAVALRDLQNR